MAQAAATSAVSPVYSAISDCVLTQDYIASADTLVSQQAANQLAAFTNPNAAGIAGNVQTEALLISLPQNNVSVLQYAARSAGNSTGWTVAPVASVPAATSIREVVAGTNLMGSSAASSVGFYSDGQQFYVIELTAPGVDANAAEVWSQPASLHPNPVSGLGSTYDALGNLYVWCTDSGSGELVMATYDITSSSWTTTVSALPTAPGTGSQAMSVNSAGVWYLLAVAQNGSAATLYSGQVGAGCNSAASLPALQTGTTTLTVASVGFGFWGPGGNPLFIVTDNAGGVWVLGGEGAATATQTQFTSSNPLGQIVGQVTSGEQGQTLNAYGLDTAGNVWALHAASDGTWAPWIPLKTGMAALAADPNPAAGQTLLSISNGNVASVSTFDPVASQWRSTSLQAPQETVYQVSRYHLQFTVTDQNGNPGANLPVRLAVGPTSGSADVCVGGVAYTLPSGGAPTEMTTDAFGRLTVMMLVTNSIAAPELVLTQGLAPLGKSQPNAAINSYLQTGTQTLNPTNPGGGLAPFTPANLQSAQLNGNNLSPAVQGNNSLAKTAVTAVQNMVGVTPSQQSSQVQATARRQGGFAFSVRPGKHYFKSFETSEAVRAHVAERRTAGGVGSIFSDIGDFGGDVFAGIEAGLIVIEEAAVDLENAVLSFTATIGNAISQAISVTISTVEDIARAVAGIFQAIETDIEDLIQWLQALFDFGDIWRTKAVIQAGIATGFSSISSLLAATETGINNWFANEENAVSSAFSTLMNKYKGGGTLAGNSGQLYSPTNQTSVPLGNGTNCGAASSNSHMNWLSNSVSANSGAPIPDPDANSSNAFSSALSGFQTSYNANSSKFAGSQSTFLSNAQTQIPNSGSWADMAIVDLLTLFEDLTLAALELANTLADDAIDLLQSIIGAIQNILDTPINSPVLQSLWNMVAEAGGQSGGDPLTLASLVSLLLAVPTTIGWKLVNGVDTSPFPANSTPPWTVPGWPFASSAVKSGERAGAPSVPTVPTNVAIAGWIGLIASPARMAGVWLGPNTPKWVSSTSLISSILQFALVTAAYAEEDLADAIADDPWLFVPLIGMATTGLGYGAYTLIGNRRPSFTVTRLALGVVGLASLAGNIYYVCTASPSPVQPVVVERILAPLPDIFNLSLVHWPPNGATGMSEIQAFLMGVNCGIFFGVPILTIAYGLD